jgi:hypothetical protein
MKDIRIRDESGDKKYFTIVPNYVLNHSRAIDQALYAQIKRIAGDNGKCFASIGYFAKQLDSTRPTIRKSLKYLIDHNWIKEVKREIVKTTGGKQAMRTFIIEDIWGLNVNNYTKGGKNDTHLKPKGGKNDTSRGEKMIPLIISNNNKNILKLNKLRKELRDKNIIRG